VALPLLVITGAHHARVVRELAGFEHAVAVRNKRWREGMASSLRLGIAQARAQTDCIAAMILLCDQPLIGCAQLQAVVDAFLADPERIAASRYDDRLGVPAVFGREHFGELLRLTGDEGARRLLRGGRNVTVVEIPEAAIDIDTPADVQRWQSDPSPPADGRDGDDPG
jgi:molybdenum cofactor cytidylyltransferase